MFSSPEFKAEMAVATRKQKCETQLSTFNKLQLLASKKILQLDEFISLEIRVRYELFVDKVKGVELAWMLRQVQGPSTQAPTREAPQHRGYRYSSQTKAFWRHRRN